MEKLKCIIVDDEPLAIKMLENYVNRTPFLQLDSSYTDPVLSLSEIKSRKPELVFLDIQMPDLNGMELSGMIPPETRIIFTTAFKQYAFDSYQVSALDFLLKPIRYQKFLEAAEKAKQWFEMKETSDSSPAKKERNSIFIKADGALRKVEFSDILYVAGMKDYVMFYLSGEKYPVVTHLTMKAVEEMLPSDYFMRVHRSYIISLNKIESIDSYNDITIGKEVIHVTDAYKSNFERYLTDNSIK
ncbi:MAG: LytTR family DNA-binding domain-containing protein [Bacteroidales bacterium]|jgi:DNA-binding LytR/AlgR family response regulator|nr:LytTR family DNA-binding domain-containing protein [Bacteroidales bacterium]MCI1785741.1 LytTR family DNA-binding domain-containing protein [Bacteroidales bacterium]